MSRAIDPGKNVNRSNEPKRQIVLCGTAVRRGNLGRWLIYSRTARAIKALTRGFAQ